MADHEMNRSRLVSGAAWGLLALVLVLTSSLLSFSPSHSQAVVAASGPAHVVYLPMVHRQQVSPPPPNLLILDRYGQERDWDWLIEHFGAVTLERGDGTASVRVLQEIEGPVALVAHVERDGQPLVGFPVMFFWPDAPLLDPALRACGKDLALVVYTKENGNAELEMGPGSFYYPPGGGAYVVWVGGPGSDCLGGLGWLGGTNHVHLDSEWEVP